MTKPSYDDLELAHWLLSKNQQSDYWTRHPIPIRPIGRLFLEPIRELCTFLAPLALITTVTYKLGVLAFLPSIPVALLLGYLLDLHLSWSIRRKRDREYARDRGRYQIVRALSHRLSLPPAEITLDLVKTMARDFEAISKERARQNQELISRKKQEQLKAEGRKNNTQNSVHDEQLSLPTINRTRAAAATGVAASYLSEAEEPSNQYWEPSFGAVNPASGLPMMGGNTFGVDVEGNTFGSGF